MNEVPITLSVLTKKYLQMLLEQGKNKRTIYAYGKDCEQILAHFGADKQLNKLIPAQVARFYVSEELLKIKSSGKERAHVSVERTKRVLRLILVWAQRQGYIANIPLPNKVKPKQETV